MTHYNGSSCVQAFASICEITVCAVKHFIIDREMMLAGGCGGGPPGQDPWSNKIFDNLTNIFEDEEEEEEEDWL